MTSGCQESTAQKIFSEKKNAHLICTFKVEGDILTTHEKVIASQKRVMTWKEHLEEWMFGNIAIVMGFYCQKMMGFPYKIFHICTLKKHGKRMF